MNSRAGDDLAPAALVERGGDATRPSSRIIYAKSQAAVDRFGAVNGLATDKFGAFRSPEGSRGPGVDDNVYEEYSTASCSTPVRLETTYSTHQLRLHRKRSFQSATVQTTTVGGGGGGSSWSTYSEDSETQEPGATNPLSDSESTPVSCTLHETETPTISSTDIAGPPSPVKKQRLICPAPHQGIVRREVPCFLSHSQNELGDRRRREHDESKQRVSARLLPTTKPRHPVDPTRIGLALRPSPVRLNSIDRNNNTTPAASMGSESSVYGRHFEDSNDRNSSRVRRFNYNFASACLEASLLERMEDRQTAQDESHEPERCRHVVSPEDLVWGSVKHYIGMVLDRETDSLLGTAVLFMAPDQPRQGSHQAAVAPNSAWVTCVQAVAGRTEVRIKNSRGGVHVAQLMLTSTALGLALFSVNVWQGTFALAFLSRVSGPASLPHRPFVDVDRSDRVYIIGYEKTWELDHATTSADARVRPGRIVDAGRHTVVEIDFTTGHLGGSIDSPAGFRGALVVRADGLLAGVVTSELLSCHRTNIDFASAHNVYALLEEL